MRPDLRLPLSMKVVGPSAVTFFHGGEMCFFFWADPGAGGVDTRRRLRGRSSSSSLAEAGGGGDGDEDDDDDRDSGVGDGGVGERRPRPMKSLPLGVS